MPKLNHYEHDTFRVYLEEPSEFELTQYPDEYIDFPKELYDEYLKACKNFEQVQSKLREFIKNQKK